MVALTKAPLILAWRAAFASELQVHEARKRGKLPREIGKPSGGSHRTALMANQNISPTTSAFHAAELSQLDAEVIVQHFLRLNPYERYLRFGYSISTRSIEQLVANHLSERGSSFFGVFGKGALVGLSHIARSKSADAAEVALSVDADFRGRGIAESLMNHALEHARHQRYRSLSLSILSENTTMLKLAEKFGFVLSAGMGQATGQLQIPYSASDRALAV